MMNFERAVAPSEHWRAPETHAADGGLSVRLLGRVDAIWHGERLRLPGSSAVALLAYLALHPGRHRREALAAALWPNGGSASAAWLRQALWQLRRTLGIGAAEVLDADDEAIGLCRGLDLDLDVHRFEAALRARPPMPDVAVQLYRGELVDGLTLECFAWDRERLNDLYEDALAGLGEQCLAQGDMTCARDAALSLVARDPLREEAHAVLIEVYGREGSRSQVSRQFRRLRDILEHELSVEPLPETVRSYQRALERAWARSAERAAPAAPEPSPTVPASTLAIVAPQPRSPVGFRYAYSVRKNPRT